MRDFIAFISLFFILLILFSCTPIEYKALDYTNHIEYKEDVSDYTQTCAETMRLQTGDCEDFAVCHAEFIGVGYIVSGLFCNDAGRVRHAWVESDDKIIDNKYVTDINDKRYIFGERIYATD